MQMLTILLRICRLLNPYPDIDMAKEMVKFAKDTILQQAAQSMLAQANQQTQEYWHYYSNLNLIKKG